MSKLLCQMPEWQLEVTGVLARSPRPLRSCDFFSVLVTTMATLFETFETRPIKVDYPDLNGGGDVEGMPRGGSRQGSYNCASIAADRCAHGGRAV